MSLSTELVEALRKLRPSLRIESEVGNLSSPIKRRSPISKNTTTTVTTATTKTAHDD